MRIHLMHVVVAGGHGLNGYKDVIDSVHWGLGALGHQVTYGVNQAVSGAVNIIFGAQVLNAGQQAQLPEDSIVYNFEQMRGLRADNIRGELRSAAKRFRFWDYSESNLAAWATLEMKYPVVHVPVGFSPNLERIPKARNQDIDVLFYGMPNEMRLSAFHAVSKSGLSAVFLCGLYGEARDELISRSKTVMNITLYSRSRVFEIVRVSYLFANHKAVVANIDPDTFAEQGVLDALAQTTPQTLQRVVFELCHDDAKRAELERAGYEFFKQRDIRPILDRAMDASR